MAIDRLSAGALSAGAQFPFYAPEQGQDRKASLTDLAESIAELMGSPASMPTQYATPTSGSTVTIAPPVTGRSVFLLVTLSAPIASLTVALPAIAVDGQELLCHSNNGITALTVSGSGAGLSGAPTTISGGGFFRLRFDRVNSVWYRVG
jgi:hypothetical protein